MKCEEVEALMIDYLDYSLSEDIRQQIEKHIESCERCLDELKDSQEIMRLMSRDEMVKPDDSLRINFYHMLHSEIKKKEQRSEESIPYSIPWYSHSQYRIAAGFALLVTGVFLGVFIHSGIKNSIEADELSQLHSEVNALKKTAMFTMLKGESSSDRIKAVNFADELNTPDDNVIDVLVKTLNQDKNVNVRMAAAYALAKFADQRPVTDSMVKSLSLQTDPILQVTLINILVEKKEKSALKPIQQIITDKSTLKEVKTVAEKGVKLLL
jgi:Putative zinc-finger